MKTYLIDSDVLIDFFKRNPQAVALIEQLAELGTMSISTLSIAELRSGWNRKDALTYLPHLYDVFSIFPVTKEVAEEAGVYRNGYCIQGVTLPTIDSLIAATAKLHKACLVTRNIKHFPMTDIEMYSKT
jgi:toxin FitB